MMLFWYLTFIGMGFGAPAVERLQNQLQQVVEQQRDFRSKFNDLQQEVQQQRALLKYFAKNEAENNAGKVAIRE